MSEEPKIEPLFTKLAGLESDLLDGRVDTARRDTLLDYHAIYVLDTIANHRGAAKAIRAEKILGLLAMEANEGNKRWLKSVVQDLVLRLKVPIGGLRVPPYGYFLIVSSNDLNCAIGPLWSELNSLLRRLRVLMSREEVASLFGQAMLKLDSEKDAA